MDFRRGSAIGRSMETESLRAGYSSLSRSTRCLFMLARLRLLIWNDALWWGEANPVARATSRFRGNFQARLLSAGHFASFH